MQLLLAHGFACVTVMERPASQMSILEQFLKDMPLGRGGSLESEEGDVEDNRAPSVPSLSSSRSFVSQVRCRPLGLEMRANTVQGV